MPFLTAREREWAGNQFGGAMQTTEEVERAYGVRDEEQEERERARWNAAARERGGLIVTSRGVWFWFGDEEPALWRPGLDSLFAAMCAMDFELPKRFVVQLRKECGNCGDFVKFDRSCDCFDNGCE